MNILTHTLQLATAKLPDYMVPVAQNVIRRLHVLTMSCNEFRRICAEASMRSLRDITSHLKAE